MDPLLAAAVIVADILLKTGAIPPPPTDEDAKFLIKKCYELVQQKMANLQTDLVIPNTSGSKDLN